ncbi:glycosyltransferase [Nocardioides sp. TF02-7]|uniref:glycosyltransferase n=1 Tax=Nocardioides sp. TF02-7 TaxID=2917724 RepID=UPI001F05B05D|nr:glycosyltransferase [Nocardioides sp. TF02-7]UMG93652.1 glycosyltransferase [Nocardioides sp. TF02-7]
MRIALVSEHANPLATLGGEDAGGQNVHVAHLAAGLARRGHDVVVHTRRDSDDQPDQVRTDAGYLVDHVPAGPPVPVPKDELPPFLDELAAGLARRWARDPVDLVHAHFWMSGVASTAAVRQLAAPVPVLQTFHALGVVKRRHQGEDDTSPPERIACEKRLLREVDHVIATCSDEVRELRALGLRSGGSSVIPCGVDVARCRPGAGADTNGGPEGNGEADGRVPPRRRQHRVLCIGRLVPRKGFETVLRALPQLPDTELLVVGGPPGQAVEGDPEARRLRCLAESLGVADRVRLLGGIAGAAVPAYLAGSDVLVTGAWYEPFGIVPVEAMACGVPVVATDVGGHRDTVVPGVTGELVPPHDVDATARAVRGLLADPGRRHAYGAAGRRRAEELYDWSTIVERTELVYRAAVGAADRKQEVRS